MVKLFLEHGADANALSSSGSSPLLAAVHRDYQVDKTLPIVELLVQHGGAVDFCRRHDNISLLHAAASSGKADVVEFLLKDPSSRLLLNLRDSKHGMTALHRAAYGGHAHVVYRLLLHRADINTIDKHGDSPLKDAKSKKHHLCCKLLETTHASVTRFAAVLEVGTTSLARSCIQLISVVGPVYVAVNSA